jgi:hypothetical protein
MRLISPIAALVAILAAVFGGYLFLDTHFAKCAELKAVEKRLDYKIENDKLMGMQQRLWQVQEKYPVPTQAPIETQKQMKELDADVDMQRHKVKQMESR